MSITLATPKTEVVTKVIKEALISSIDIDVLRKRIVFGIVFGETKNGNFAIVKRKMVVAEKADFTEIASKACDANKTIYENIGAIGYAWLGAKGHLTI